MLNKKLKKDIYWKNFNRNIGIVSKEEQNKLKDSTVAIAGLGGVGGKTFINLCRIGIGNFVIADPEKFQHSDINRQQGAALNTIGMKKINILKKMAKNINRDIKIKTFPEGLTIKKIDEFLEGVDAIVDGLDFHLLKLRKELYDKARLKKLFIFTSPIFGFGTTLAVFSPYGPSFERLFGKIPEKITLRNAVRFSLFFFPFIPKYIDIESYVEAIKKNRPIPSISSSASLSASLTSNEILLFLLKKRRPITAPKIKRIDLFEEKISVINPTASYTKIKSLLKNYKYLEKYLQKMKK